MRLICPNCGAQYEVEDSVIPDDGRDVQCSNCGHTWFQRPGHADAELAEELGEDVVPPADTADAPPGETERARRSLDPEVADVLREEAAREAAARRGESAGLETQTELGLDDPGESAASRSAAARARMARMRGVDEGSPEAAAAALAAAAAPRRDLLPDIEEINSSLTASQDRAEPVPEGAEPEPAAAPQKESRGGFRRGFLLVIVLAVVALAVYLQAPRIAAALPQAEPYLADYVAFVNGLRVQAAAGVDAAMAQFRALTGGTGDG